MRYATKHLLSNNTIHVQVHSTIAAAKSAADKDQQIVNVPEAIQSDSQAIMDLFTDDSEESDMRRPV